MLDRRSFLRQVATAILGGAVGPLLPRQARAQRLTKVKFALPWIPSGHMAFFFAAQQLGYWKKRGLEVQLDRGYGSGEVCKAVGLEQYDYGLPDVAVMITSAAKGLDLTSIAMVQHISPIALFSLKGRNIRTPKDLEGKTIGTSPQSVDFQLWPAFVEATKIDAAKVRFSFINPGVHIPALLDGRIDLLGSFYPTTAPVLWSQHVEFNVMLYAAYGLQMYSGAIITLRKRAREKPEECAALVQGAMEGLAYSYLNPEQTVEIFLDAVRTYQGAPTHKGIIRDGIGINAVLGLAKAAEEHGLGWTDPGSSTRMPSRAR
ncbi:MAG: ABC transporter substrate-binding protein [Deltaproteobacteria bacterium]|nr:ABC transporter substrate-binding protein [Deltaproteobacteria bacterium]